MDWTTTLLLIVPLFLGLSQANDECYKGQTPQTLCMTSESPSSTVDISCPALFAIKIDSFTHTLSQDDSCDSSNRCEMSYNGLDPVRSTCEDQQSCTVSFSLYGTSSPCTQNAQSSSVIFTYHCEPMPKNQDYATSAELCDITYGYKPSVILNLFSPKSVRSGTLSNSDSIRRCGVKVTIPSNAEVTVNMTSFQKTPGQANECDQHILLWDNDAANRIPTKLCSKNDGLIFGCSDNPRDVNIMYIAQDATVHVTFSFKVFVHLKNSIELSLADTYALTNIATGQDLSQAYGRLSQTPPIDDTDPSEPDPPQPNTGGDGNLVPDTGDNDEDEGDNQQQGGEQSTPSNGPVVQTDDGGNWKLPVLIAMIGFGVFVVLVVLLIIFIKHRNMDKQALLEEEHKKTHGKHLYVTDIYLEGDGSSTLVLDKRDKNHQV